MMSQQKQNRPAEKKALSADALKRTVAFVLFDPELCRLIFEVFITAQLYMNPLFF